MFFRRTAPKTASFQDRIESLKTRGFTVTPQAGGTLRVGREPCAVDIREQNGAVAWQGRAGILIGAEIAVLVDEGYQKFFRTPGGIKKPATAEELAALHNFEADLKEALGEISLYNQSLGTVSTFYQYDRVEDRDRGVPKRAWE